MTVLDDVRVEVAFSADPNTTSPAFVDLTSRARLDAGISITRGRQDEMGAVSAGQCSLTFDNTDGVLTPGLATSPYYPNVKPQNRLRVTYRDPAGAAGNLLSIEDASFEGGTVGNWVGGGFGPAAVSNSTTHPRFGTKGMLITWAGLLGDSAQLHVLDVPLVLGRTYTLSAYVWVPVGSPGVRLVTGAYSTTTGASERISYTFTATTTELDVRVWPNGSPTAGQQCWVDGVQLDEGSSVRTFTTSPPVISYRFDGYVDEWPTAWPTGGQAESTVTITAVDLQSRISRQDSLDSVIAETYKLAAPVVYFPLGEPSDSTTAGDLMGGAGTLAVEASGAGVGTITFADGTGPPTDGAGAPVFTPTDVNNGVHLMGRTTHVDWFSSSDFTLVATFRTTSPTAQTAAQWGDVYGSALEVGVNASGTAYARWINSWATAAGISATSVPTYADGLTHSIAATLSISGGSPALTLTVDGTVRATTAWTGGGLPAFDVMRVGGARSGQQFAGTISHVAGFDSALSLATLQGFHAACTTGFAGERSDQRIARIASWMGIPAGLQALDVGAATIAHVDSSGRGAWDYMQDVATTEAGALFVSASGLLTFYNRGRSYATATAPIVTVTADVIDPGTRIVENLSDVINDVTVSRTGGATAHLTDAASVSVFGLLPESVTIVANTDGEAYDRAGWILATRSQPMPRLPELGLDALTDPTTSPSVRWVDIYSRVAVTGMPSQTNPTYDLRVQGYREQIGSSGWDVVANTTPYLLVRPFILDDAVYGQLDSNSLAF